MDYKQSFYSPGKLLITGEYLVIDGAKAFSLPTKKGQRLKIKPSNNKEIQWASIDSNGETWFEGKFNSIDFSIITSSDEEIASRLAMIIKAADHLDKRSLLQNGWHVRTELDFPNNWGLGSSSTLLCNLAKWLEIDPYKLHFTVSKGSGYDIACGMKATSLVYSVHNQIPKIEKIKFSKSFTNQIYFIHLNKKQYSDKEVDKYSQLKLDIDLGSFIQGINDITSKLLETIDLKSFETLLSEHEQLLSYLLQKETSQEELFQMYSGGITKYLGAWGGDFVLVTTQKESDLDYFRNKGYETIISYSDMVKE